MREIDNLIEDIALHEEDYLHIEEVPLTENEYERINNSTMLKINRIQDEEKRTTSITKKHSIKKQIRILLIAAALMISSTTLVAAIGNGTIEGLFSVILGGNASHIGSSGKLIGRSNTAEGITLSIEGAIGDKNTMQLLFDLKKENEESFDGDHIRFEEVLLNLDGEESNLLGVTSWLQYDVIKTIENDPSVRRLQFKTGSIEEIEGKNVTFTARNIIEYSENTSASQVDLVKCIKEDGVAVNGATIPNKDRRYNERLIGVGDEQEIAFKESIPSHLLPLGNLNIMLYPDLPKLKLDNIGFINEELHIRINNPIKDIVLEDSDGNQIDSKYQVINGDVGYYVYPVANRDELSQISCLINTDKEIKRTEGTWEVSFAMDTQSEYKMIETDLEVPLTNVRNIGVEQIEFSKLSLAVTYKEDERALKYPDINIIFIDGSKILVSDKDVMIDVKSGNLRRCIYDFDKPIDIDQVGVITINNIEIPIK
ncbi:MAG: hypothetical protein ACRCW2_10830 [Cellulosilyticaceae bacterium]